MNYSKWLKILKNNHYDPTWHTIGEYNYATDGCIAFRFISKGEKYVAKNFPPEQSILDIFSNIPKDIQPLKLFDTQAIEKPCPYCEGTGQRKLKITCPTCNGTGKCTCICCQLIHECGRCGGSGILNEGKVVVCEHCEKGIERLTLCKISDNTWLRKEHYDILAEHNAEVFIPEEDFKPIYFHVEDLDGFVMYIKPS